MGKILLVAREFYPTIGGISTYIHDIYSCFPADELRIVTYRHPEQNLFDSKCRYKIIRTARYSKFFRKGKWAVIPLFLTAFRILLFDRTIREIHAEQVQSGMAVLILARLFRKPYRVFAYGMEINTSDAHGLKRRVYKAANNVIAISRYTRQLLVDRGVSEDRIRLFYPGVRRDYARSADTSSVERARRELLIDPDKTILLTIARLDPSSRYKGIDMALCAVKKLHDQGASLRYYIAGSGPDKTWYEDQIRQFDLENVVSLVGAVTEEEKRKFLAACDIFLMPNRIAYERGGQATEGFGIVFIEAAIYGKPAVGGEGGARDAVDDGVSGLYVNPNSADDIAEKLLLLIRQPDYRRKLGEQGKQRVVDNFITEQIAERFHDYIGRR